MIIKYYSILLGFNLIKFLNDINFHKKKAFKLIINIKNKKIYLNNFVPDFSLESIKRK